MIFLSHMGECNLDLYRDRPVVTRTNFPYAGAIDPLVACGCLKGGDAVFVNLAPIGERFRLILTPVEMLDVPNDGFDMNVRGWMRPRRNVAPFLEEMSRLGCTHHSVLCYGACINELKLFGELCGFEVCTIT